MGTKTSYYLGRAGRRGGAAWLPKVIGGCVAYYRSDLGAYQDAAKTVPCVADSLIWTGEDQVSPGVNDLIQAIESQRFVYKENILDGHPSWRLDGADDCIVNVDGPVATMLTGDDIPWSVFMVLESNGADEEVLFAWQQAMWSGNFTWLYNYVASYLVMNMNNTLRNTWPNGLSAAPHALLITFSGTLANIWFDNVQVLTNGDFSAVGSQEMHYFVLGAIHQGQYFWKGDFFEKAVYDNEISEASRALLNTYAVARYPSI